MKTNRHTPDTAAIVAVFRQLGIADSESREHFRRLGNLRKLNVHKAERRKQQKHPANAGKGGNGNHAQLE